jgi:hypothetical protein
LLLVALWLLLAGLIQPRQPPHVSSNLDTEPPAIKPSPHDETVREAAAVRTVSPVAHPGHYRNPDLPVA